MTKPSVAGSPVQRTYGRIDLLAGLLGETAPGMRCDHWACRERGNRDHHACTGDYPASRPDGLGARPPVIRHPNPQFLCRRTFLFANNLILFHG